jgi:YegS/Rv2252/BmrU family lipid kinase
MTSSKRIAAIVNPRSARGKTGRNWRTIAQKLERRLGPLTACFTESPGAGIELARGLVAEGYDFLIAVGGDGTANEVVNGIIEHDRNLHAEVCLGLLPMGTGGDFRRSLGISTNIDEAVETLYSGFPAPIDVGKATYQTYEGQAATRYFVNLVSFGMGGDVASRARNALGALGGRAAFFWATLTSFIKYGGRKVKIHLDGTDHSYFITNIAIGNGRFHGGGMHPCPKALMNDGVLEVTVIDHLSAWELIRDIHYLYSDDVYRHPKVHHLRATTVSAQAEEVTKIEIDGEPLGTLPLEVSLLPDRLKVTVPDGSPLATDASGLNAGKDS